MIQNPKIVIVNKSETDTSKIKQPFVKYCLSIKKRDHVKTKSNEKQNANNVIAGGYNKQYSQPSKKELDELEK